MPKQERHKTDYPGVYFVWGTIPGTDNAEKIFYVYYRKNGRFVEEKAGRQTKDAMTAAKASRLRAQRIEGAPSNKERRDAEKTAREAQESRWTINRLWSEYIANNPTLKGMATDTNRFTNHVKPAFGDMEPKAIAPLDVDRLRLKLLKNKQPGTVRNVLELLRRLTNFGVKRRLCEGLSFTIQLPKVNNLKTEDLTTTQVKNLLTVLDQEASTNPQVTNLMKLVLFTGMRRGEVFRLRWEDIDLQRSVIHLRDPKGGTDQTIPLSDRAREVLQGHQRGTGPYVFPGRKGNMRTDMKNAVKRIKKLAGIPNDFRWLHGLRHYYATVLASSGAVDMFTLQKLLTHKSPLMTQRYAHLRDESLRKASNLMADLIDETVSGTKQEEPVIKGS